jgi:hypothetical protein
VSTCPGCDREYRTGITVTLLDPITGPERKRVCQRCAAGGMVIVSPRIGPVVKGIARESSEDVAQAVRMLRTYATAAKASRDECGDDKLNAAHFGGRLEGLEVAIELLTRGSS